MKKYSFKKWIRNWLSQDDYLDSAKITVANQIDHDSLSSDPIRMNIYSASGGYVIETKTYDRQKDRSNANLYIIKDDTDLGEELSKIITMTALSR